jgi:hypothetical protein
LGISWSDSGSSHQRIYLAKHAFPHPFFMEVFMIAAWCIWTERNRLIFSNNPLGYLLGSCLSRRKFCGT